MEKPVWFRRKTGTNTSSPLIRRYIFFSNFSNKIEIVVGYGWINGGWFAGNLSYHLESRPKWKTELKDEINIGTIWIQGFNKIDNCKGVMYQIKPLNDICMFGKK